MRLPRIKFTVRRMMIAVALFAVAFVVVGIPVCDRLLWLCQAPFSTNLVMTSLKPEWLWLKAGTSAGKPVTIRCPYVTTIGSSIPKGLPYRVVAEVKLIDPEGAVVESRRQISYPVAGTGWGTSRGELKYDVTPPRPGFYTVRYEATATDLFGRTGEADCTTGGFQAR